MILPEFLAGAIVGVFLGLLLVCAYLAISERRENQREDQADEPWIDEAIASAFEAAEETAYD